MALGLLKLGSLGFRIFGLSPLISLGHQANFFRSHLLNRWPQTRQAPHSRAPGRSKMVDTTCSRINISLSDLTVRPPAASAAVEEESLTNPRLQPHREPTACNALFCCGTAFFDFVLVGVASPVKPVVKSMPADRAAICSVQCPRPATEPVSHAWRGAHKWQCIPPKETDRVRGRSCGLNGRIFRSSSQHDHHPT